MRSDVRRRNDGKALVRFLLSGLLDRRPETHCQLEFSFGEGGRRPVVIHIHSPIYRREYLYTLVSSDHRYACLYRYLTAIGLHCTEHQRIKGTPRHVINLVRGHRAGLDGCEPNRRDHCWFEL
jgi:hypothetical protein